MGQSQDMENKKNYDIFNIISETIIKWYDQTHITMTISKMPFSRINSELMGILLVSRKQTLGAITTLANNHILSVPLGTLYLIEYRNR